MAKWGNCNFGELKKLQGRLGQMNKGSDMDIFFESCVKELTARLLALVIKDTPVGKYPKSAGKKGGTLRRGWTADTEEAATSGGQKNAKQWASDAIITKKGNAYEIEIFNPVHYAPYVEYGHRTPSGKGWVIGRFMLTRSQMLLERQMPGIIDKMIKRFLEEMFNGK